MHVLRAFPSAIPTPAILFVEMNVVPAVLLLWTHVTRNAEILASLAALSQVRVVSIRVLRDVPRQHLALESVGVACVMKAVLSTTTHVQMNVVEITVLSVVLITMRDFVSAIPAQ